VAEFKKASELDPKNADLHTNLGRVLAQLGRRDEAMAEFKKASELDPQGADPHPHYKQSAELPYLVSAEDEAAQASYVADHVLQHREAGIALKRQAVLFRAAHHSDLLDIELGRRNIPFVKYGGLKFLEAAHVKDVLAPEARGVDSDATGPRPVAPVLGYDRRLRYRCLPPRVFAAA
jgi:tetratricopeptide (TPR) repeat protein